MDSSVTNAVDEAKKVILTEYETWSMIVAFIFGGLTSAVWTWKEAVRKPRLNEVASTMFVSGMFAVGVVCWLMKYNIPIYQVIAISILVGFAGDIIIRGLIRAVGKLAEGIFSENILSMFKSTKGKDDGNEARK